MHLEVHQTINDVNTGRFQALRPCDVVALIEARLQFDQHRDLLAALGRFDQQIDQRRIGADAIQRDLDGDDVRIFDRGAQERLDRGKGVERVMDHEILIRDLIEHPVGIVRRPQDPRRQGRRLEGRPVQRVERVPVAVAEPIGGADHDVLVDFEIFDQDGQHALRHVGLDLQQRQRTIAQLLQPAVNRFEQVVRFILLDHHVGVADDAEQVRAFDLGARKQLLDITANDVLEKDVRDAGQRRDVVGQRDEPRQHAGHLDAREFRAAGVPHAYGEVHAEVRDIGERMARVERERRQDRKDVILEILREPAVDRRRVIGRLQKMDTFRGEQRTQRLTPARGLIVDLRQCAAADRRELLIRRLPVDRQVFDAGPEFLQDGRDAHHEELIKIGAGDREELDAVE